MVKLPIFIAGRYLVSKRKKNFINVISILAVIGVAFTTAALVVVLSVFNGLEDLLRSLNNAFDADLKVIAVKGKSFSLEKDRLAELQNLPEVESVTQVIEDYAYVRYHDANQVVTLKGVSDEFLGQRSLDRYITAGELGLHRDGQPLAIIGIGIQYYLSVAVENQVYPMQVYYIKNVSSSMPDPSKLYTRRSIIPGSVFSVAANFDENYMIVPLDFARSLFDYGDRRTSLEIQVGPDATMDDVKRSVGQLLGGRFSVLSREEQHRDLYRLLRMEKLFVFFSLTLLLAVGSISIFFGLMMLALDKRRDISVLAAMGASPGLIQSIFLTEGAFIAGIGVVLGLLLGGLLCWIQMRYGILSMGMETAVTDGYPVKLVWSDLVSTLLVTAVMTIAISLRPAWLASRSASVQNL